jgi:hypothetical protein
VPYYFGELGMSTADALIEAVSTRLALVEGRLKRALASGVLEIKAQKGDPGVQGPPGPPGPPGPMPLHRWEGTSLQFQQGPNGDEWGEAVDLQGPKGDNVGGGGVAVINGANYFPGGWA